MARWSVSQPRGIGERDQPRCTDARRKLSISGCRVLEIQNVHQYEDSRTMRQGRRATNGKQQSVPSGREALVAMVQPADLRYGDDTAAPRWLDGTRVRTILLE